MIFKCDRRAGRRPAALALLLAVGLGGCEGLLDVKNPNNIKQEDLENPAAAAAVVNGALATLSRGINAILTPISTVTDELTWIGSRDAWQQLDFGFLDDPANEFTDDAFKYIAEGRFMADEAIRLTEQFDAEGTLPDRNNLARAYLYGGVAYVTIADIFDEFAFSNRTEAAEPITGTDMIQVYDQAIEYLNKGIIVAEAEANSELVSALLAVRARAEFGKAVFMKLNPVPANPAEPLVASAKAAADALTVLGRVAPDWELRFNLNNNDVAFAGEASLFYNVNQRGELQLGPAFVQLDATRKKVEGISIQDPIDQITDPVITRTVTAFKEAGAQGWVTVVSAREMHLIVAEVALATGDLATFTQHINAIRALDGLTPFTGQIDPVELLIHERRVNLFLQGRRLADIYRFGIDVAELQPTSTAVTAPGTFLPVTIIERRANCFYLGTC